MSKKLSSVPVFWIIVVIALGAVLGLRILSVRAAFGDGNSPGGTPISTVDLSRYVRVGRFNLPESTRTTPPPNSLLAQEASGVTYDWDTNTLFVVGDGGTSVVQVTKTGQLIDSMTLAPGASPQGTDFYDTEGITYIGNGKFVLMEERYRQANLFTYVAGGTLHRADAQAVKLGTTVGNIGLEGVSWDPLTSGYICVKEKDPESVFQTGIDFVAGTATNGSPTTTNSTDLFTPALANLADFSDVFALSNLPSLNGHPDFEHLLILSQESGQIRNIDRSGNISSTLTIVGDPDNPLSVADQTHEGLTMDRDGNLYTVSENGGGDSNHPQLWVYGPSTAPNQAPTAVVLHNTVNSIPDNTSTAAPIKLADIVVTDDGLGNNDLTVTGTDASFFQIIGTALYLKAGTVLNAVAKPNYGIMINVNDTTVGSDPDVTVNYTLNVTAATGGTPTLIISEVAPWSSGNSSLAADWFEVTNIGTAAANVTNWRMDDNSNSFAASVPLSGVTSIAPGESVIFIETATDLSTQFKSIWFGAAPPLNLQVGRYSGSGVGLSTGGDAVNLFDSVGTVQARVDFGANAPSGPYPTFDNATGLNNSTITALSAPGINGAFSVNDMVGTGQNVLVGSPGTIGAPTAPTVSIVATDANAAEAGSDPGTFRITRTASTLGPLTVSYTIASGAGQAVPADYTPALNGSVTIGSGQAFADITITPVDDALVEGNETVTLTLSDTGGYDVGSPAVATVTIADNDAPIQPGSIIISEVAPWSSSSSIGVDWFEITNTGSGTVNPSTWKMDDNSNSFAVAVALNGITSIRPGESVIYMETADLPGKSAAFKSLWFGANPPASLQIGSYSGSGVGLSTTSDAVNLFDGTGNRITGVNFGASPAGPLATFDNKAGLGSTTLPLPNISLLSSSGVNGAFVAANDANEIGSPGTIANRNRSRADFDGDGKTDLSVFRPSDGNWYAFKSGGAVQITNWGSATDTLVPGDYDNDGKTDTAVYRPSTGQWFILRSSDSTLNILTFGITGDVPVVGDYDGDGKTDVAQFRPSQGVWYVFRSSDNGVSITTWGEASDLTVPADYDGDGKTDVAVFRPSTGVWYVYRSTGGPMVVGWGVAEDKPVEADYDGDGKDDVAIYRPSEGNWYVFRSSDNTPLIVNWGNATDAPSPGDYDGDGKDDYAVFRDGTWFAYESMAGPVVSSWGAAGDTSIPSKYIP